MRIYSRQPAFMKMDNLDERPRKRIRMDDAGFIVEEKIGAYEEEPLVKEDPPKSESTSTKGTLSEATRSSSITAPSSPVSGGLALFSSDAAQDDESELSSLPSSPPPLPSPPPAVRKPAFSFLKRKRSMPDDGSGSRPLSDITANARKIPRSAKDLTQMKIDLGGDVRKACRSCGMEYIPSVKEDSALHSRYCAMNVGGVDMGKAFLRDESVKRVHSEKAQSKDRERVVVVDRKSSSAARNGTRKVLEVVNAELSSVNIDESELWDVICPEKSEVSGLKETRKKSIDKTVRRDDRFKAFLYMVEDRCVGLCLAEKISEAFPVVQTKPGEQIADDVKAVPRSSSLSVATTSDIALLGISRIWISKFHRGRGLAMELLDCARNNFFYGVAAPKSLVAFSQPTDSGGRLAEHWFENKTGWHIYAGR